MLLLLTSVVTLAACCLSAPFTKTLIVYYDIADVQPSGVTSVANLNAPEEFYPDFVPPLTEMGTYAPPPPPPPPQQDKPPKPVPPAAIPPPFFPTVSFQFPTFFPYGFHGFSYFTYVAPGFQFVFMFMYPKVTAASGMVYRATTDDYFGTRHCFI